MEVTLAGIVIEERLVQVWNAETPMVFSWELSLKVTVVRAEQFWNAYSSMEVTLAGMLIESRSFHAANA